MIKLSSRSLELLTKCLEKHAPKIIPTIKNPDYNDYTIDFYNQLRQIVGDEFINNGLKADYEPNEYGIALEELIDEIGRLFM